MPCTNCFNNCAPSITDRCVKYTGPDIPLLGICNGDNLYSVEAVILEKLQTALDGTGITFADLTIDCDFLNDIIDGEDETLAVVIQALVTASCSLRELIQEIQDQLAVPLSITGSCLTLPANPTRDQVLSAIATKLCLVDDRVTAIEADYVKASDLCAAVTVCLSGSSSTQEYTKMPKYVALPYVGPLTVFDSSGKGISAFGYDKVYICNGNNGTQDYRGRAAVGANTGVAGGTLDSAVDPSLAANAGYSFVANTKKGAYTHTLSSNESAPHTHLLTDPGHTHGYTKIQVGAHPGGNNVSRPTTEVNGTTTSSTTGITMGSSGGGQPHNNVQPSFGAVWIIFLP